jgi:hypothetical protein
MALRKRMTRALKLTAAAVILGYVSYVVYATSPLEEERRKAAFIVEWSTTFRLAQSLDLMKQTGAYTRTFPNGQWVAAVCEHSCCSGRGFDATVVYDSEGVVLAERSYRFCGMETMWSEMDSVPARSVDEFYRGLKEKYALRLERVASGARLRDGDVDTGRP